MFGYLFAIIALFIWGLIVIPIRKTKTSGLYGIGISMLVAFAALLIPAIIIFMQKGLVFSSGRVLMAALVGVFQFSIGTAFYYEGIRLAGASVGAPLSRLKPIIVGFIALVFGIELLSFNQILAGVIVSIGAGMLIYAPGRNVISRDGMKKGIVFALATPFFWAIGDILVKQLQTGAGAMHPLLLTEMALLSGLIVYYSVIFLEKKQDMIFKMPRDDKKKYAMHGLLSLSIAYLAFFASIGIIGLMKAVIITTAWPLISMIVGVAFLKEGLNKIKLFGGILIVVSVYLTLS